MRLSFVPALEELMHLVRDFFYYFPRVQPTRATAALYSKCYIDYAYVGAGD